MVGLSAAPIMKRKELTAKHLLKSSCPEGEPTPAPVYVSREVGMCVVCARPSTISLKTHLCARCALDTLTDICGKRVAMPE